MAPSPTESTFVAAWGLLARKLRACDDADASAPGEGDAAFDSDEPLPAMRPGREVKYLRSRVSLAEDEEEKYRLVKEREEGVFFVI